MYVDVSVKMPSCLNFVRQETRRVIGAEVVSRRTACFCKRNIFSAKVEPPQNIKPYPMTEANECHTKHPVDILVSSSENVPNNYLRI